MADSFLLTPVSWTRAFRIIPSRYPPIDIFEDLTSSPEEWDLLIELESATNPRVRQEVGEISLVPVAQRVHGPGASYVMAAFTHFRPEGSRFSDGTFGVYYAAARLQTAIKETVYHLGRRLLAGAAAPDDLDQRVLVGAIAGAFVDLTSAPAPAQPYQDPEDYSASQHFGAEARRLGREGVLYTSVRDPSHPALAVFHPPCITPPVQERHLRYHWDGGRISKYFDYRHDEWFPAP